MTMRGRGENAAACWRWGECSTGDGPVNEPGPSRGDLMIARKIRGGYVITQVSGERGGGRGGGEVRGRGEERGKG